MSNSKSMHPNINSIIDMKELARSQKMRGDWFGLLDTLDTLMREIKEDEQDSELKNLIKREIDILDNLKSATAKNKRILNKKWDYSDWYEKIIQILWDNDYLDNSKYNGFFDPSGGKKSGRDTIRNLPRKR